MPQMMIPPSKSEQPRGSTIVAAYKNVQEFFSKDRSESFWTFYRQSSVGLENTVRLVGCGFQPFK